MIKSPYNNAYGLWRVTTEGDCEGKTTRELGTYEGYIDEIAFALADQCCYSLRFESTNHKLMDTTPKRKTVNISLNVDSGTWQMTPAERAKAVGELLRDRPVEVANGEYYASVKLTTNTKTIEEKKADALAKLTEEERKLLGLE